MTSLQDLGRRGEEIVCDYADCPRCKRPRTMRRLPTNFKCADVICDFCGYLGQVKAVKTPLIDRIPDQIRGAAWGVQLERMDAGIFYPLFLVLIDGRRFACYYLAADLQSAAMFVARKPLGPHARRAGWQGFMYVLREKKHAFVRLFGSETIAQHRRASRIAKGKGQAALIKLAR